MNLSFWLYFEQRYMHCDVMNEYQFIYELIRKHANIQNIKRLSIHYREAISAFNITENQRVTVFFMVRISWILW